MKLVRWLIRDGHTEKHRRHREDEAHRSPKHKQILSRALTVAACMAFLKCGKLLAIPTWLAMPAAYGLAALVPMKLPAAHGDTCRVATTMAASTIAAMHVSRA